MTKWDYYLSKFLTFKGDQVQASDVSQYRLMPPTPLNPTSKNKYPVENVKAYMGKVADAGFGRVVESVKKGSKRKSTTFYKYTYDELEDEQTNTLKKLKIDRSTYEDSFLDLSSSQQHIICTCSTTNHIDNPNFWRKYTSFYSR